MGAVDETKGQTGAAHFLEHMMFKGTSTIGTKNFAKEKKLLSQIEQVGQALDDERSKGNKADQKRVMSLAAQLKKLQDEHRKYYIPNEIDRLYTENGGENMNATTGQDITTYFISLPSNKIELWARIESDRLLNPVFREFYTERDVILEERRQRVETSPDGKLYESFMNKAYRSILTVCPLSVPRRISSFKPDSHPADSSKISVAGTNRHCGSRRYPSAKNTEANQQIFWKDSRRRAQTCLHSCRTITNQRTKRGGFV